MLVRQREQASNGDQVNLDLTYSVSRLSDASAKKKKKKKKNFQPLFYLRLFQYNSRCFMSYVLLQAFYV